MIKTIGLLSIAGFLGLHAVADAQTSAPSATIASLDGAYAYVSSAKVNQTYVSRGGTTGFCPDRAPGPLTIGQGRARYATETGLQVDGTVGPGGELAMRSVTAGPSRPIELRVSGRIDGSGTVRARQRGNSCSYDFVWQKRS
jgi:hypothetical protein